MSGVRRLTETGLLAALGCALSVLENALPPLPVPGARLGLANLAEAAALFWLGLPSAAGVGAAKCLTVLLTRGGIAAAHSLCGTALSLLVMAALRPLVRREYMSMVGVSVLGAAAHTVGQLLCIRLLLGETAGVLAAPLLICSAASGILTGILLNLALPRLSRAAGANFS